MYYFFLITRQSCHPWSREDWYCSYLLKTTHCTLLSTDVPSLTCLLVDESTLTEGIGAARRVGLKRLKILLLGVVVVVTVREVGLAGMRVLEEDLKVEGRITF